MGGQREYLTAHCIAASKQQRRNTQRKTSVSIDGRAGQGRVGQGRTGKGRSEQDMFLSPVSADNS